MRNAIANSLLEIKAVSLRLDPPFTWASGRFSPIYCDNRMLMSFPKYRKQVAQGFAELIKNKGWKPDIIAGTATAGIPHAAWLADLLDLPMIYVRGSAKGHGKGNKIEGALEPEKKVVLIEDLISTGGSSIEAANGVIEAGGELLGVAAIFTYGLEKAAQRFSEAKMECETLTSFNVLMQEAVKMGSLGADNMKTLEDWQKNPGAWSSERGGAS